MIIGRRMAAISLLLMIYGLVITDCTNDVVSPSLPGKQDSNNVYETGLNIEIDITGSYKIKVENITWLTSAPTFLRHDNQTASTENGTLKLTNLSTESGEDQLGSYRETTMLFMLPKQLLRFHAIVKEYERIPLILFTQYFIDGANSTSAFSVDGICSGFPGFKVEPADDDLGYLSFGGTYLGDQNKRIGRFNKSSTINGGMPGGPLVTFDHSGRALILSPFDNFMAASFWQDAPTGGNLYGGIMGGVSRIQPGYRQTFSVFYGTSINKAFDGWGRIIRTYYEKGTTQRHQDLTLNYLGYWTSKGMYYYFHTEENKTYEETMVDIRERGKKLDIPFRYFQYGPWWYYRDSDGGVKTWKARPDVFPDGFSALERNLGLPATASTSFWSSDTTYAKQNGGKYDFILQNHTALPLDQRFWEDLFQNASRWNLTTYQQGFMSTQMSSTEILCHDINLGRNWLLDMGAAAGKMGISLQYDMVYPRQALQALEIQAVTQVTVANESSPANWRIGVTSLLASSLGLAPSHGPFLTKPPDNITDNPMVGSLVATLSTGPVGVGDDIGEINMTILMKCCNRDGLILSPEHPVVALDKQILKAAFKDIDGPEGEAWISYSDISGLRFANLLVLGIKEGTQFSITQRDTGLFDHADDNDLYYIPYNDPVGWGILTTFGSLVFTDACTVEDFCLFQLATAIPDWFMTVIFGEIDKWIPMSPKRVLSISWTNETVTAPLRGSANETFDFWYMLGSKANVVTCTLSVNGSATFQMDNNLGIATCG